jgi:hypothetical protein
MQYFIRHLQSGSHDIIKFNDGDLPEAVYTVTGQKCTCPGGTKRGTCKHIAMIARWKPFHYFEGDLLLPLPEDLMDTSGLPKSIHE